jgi:hypothetical protein
MSNVATAPRSTDGETAGKARRHVSGRTRVRSAGSHLKPAPRRGGARPQRSGQTASRGADHDHFRRSGRDHTHADGEESITSATSALPASSR